MADESVGQIRPRDRGPALGSTDPMLETRTRRLDSTKESIDRVEREALEMAARSGFRESIVGHIGLAVREIMINAVIHGNGCDPHKAVVVTISRTSDRLKIVIADEGEGFDPYLLPDPLSPEGLLKGALAVVYTWPGRLWTNFLCNATLRAGRQ